MSVPSSSPISASAPRMDARGVLRALEEMSERLQPGDALPTQLELSRLFNASDRAVRWALDELRREGRIVSRRRVGTVVAERTHSQSNGHAKDDNANAASQFAADMVVNSRTIVAIAVPGQTLLHRAFDLLFQQTQLADLPLICRLFEPRAAFPFPSAHPLGYLLLGRELFGLGKQLQEAGQRVVVFGTPSPNAKLEVPCVCSDQEHGGYLVTKHLLNLGHRHIAFRGTADWSQTRRWRGHQQALAEARRQGLEVKESFVFDDLYEQWRLSPQLAADYFQRPDAPTAIIAWNDQTAASLLSLLSYVNVRVPSDVALIGYDNLPEGLQVHPPLTTVDVGLEHQLRAAVRLLTQPSPPPSSQMVMVPTTLLSRESTLVPK